MELSDLLRMGAGLIQNNSDEATTGLDADLISSALGGLLGGDGAGGLDLSAIIGKIASSAGESGGLMEMVGSWMGSGENASIDPDQIGDLLGGDKISEFADSLGISLESAKQALADSLPGVIDQATPEGDGGMLGNLMASVGGSEGAIGMVGKLFGR
jgi:uncharacterized protein YidB (DUF937 family)